MEVLVQYGSLQLHYPLLLRGCSGQYRRRQARSGRNSRRHGRCGRHVSRQYGVLGSVSGRALYELFSQLLRLFRSTVNSAPSRLAMLRRTLGTILFDAAGVDGLDLGTELRYRRHLLLAAAAIADIPSNT